MKWLVPPPPSASFLKNPQLNFEANTGHIKEIKHSTERYNLQLSDAPGNVESGEELVNIQSDYLPISFCIIDQKCELKL